ncbi:Nectin-1 [Merluccius polli]|uniref:Nectin-1 n=1 Tax=Merluccius polli TaxID=89951 RepID=A0AA47M9B7_MERPO|nr:Nectin-1 [Merluccius polli]
MSYIGTHGQSVEMDADKSGYVGSKVDLRCRFLNSSPPVKISQVTWQKVVNGSKQNVAIANPSLGVSVAPPFRDRVAFKSAAVRRRTPALEDTTLTFSALRLTDDAMYICEYTTFPAGNRESTVNLTVFARPTTQMSLSSPSLVARASNVKTPVATCTSANGKPPGTIRWETRVAGGEATSREFRNADGTVTVQSEYMLVPSKDTHRETLTCVTTYNDEEVFTDSVTLDIQYEPDVSVEGFDGNWYLNRENVQLSCQVDANPRVTLYQWKLVNGTMPSSVEAQDNTLTFSGPLTYDLEGTYVCDATNSIGTRSASVEVSIIEKPLPQIAAGDVISVVALLLAAGVLMGITVTVLVLKIRSRKDGDSSDSPSSKLSQPVRKRPGDDFQHAGKFYEELPNTADYVSYRLACNKEDYPEPYSPPIPPPLSFLPQHPYAPADPGPAAGAAAAAARPAAAMNQAASRNTFSPPSHTTAIFKYPSMPGMTSPPPGVAPYTFPKEQYGGETLPPLSERGGEVGRFGVGLHGRRWIASITRSDIHHYTVRFGGDRKSKRQWKTNGSLSSDSVASRAEDQQSRGPAEQRTSRAEDQQAAV